MRDTDSFVVIGTSRESVERRLLALRAKPDADWTSYRLDAIGAGRESVPLATSVRLVQQAPSTPPTALPDPSSERLRRRGYAIVGGGGLLGAVNGVVAGVARNPFVAALGFGLVLVVVGIGAYVAAKGFSKRAVEKAHGDTVDMVIGRLHPELWILDFRTFAVCFAPELRPDRPSD